MLANVPAVSEDLAAATARACCCRHCCLAAASDSLEASLDGAVASCKGDLSLATYEPFIVTGALRHKILDVNCHMVTHAIISSVMH